MTKPITGIAMAMMYDEGKWKLDDPVTKHIPEFANLKVKLANGTLVPPNKPITMAMVVSHSAGFPGGLGVRSDTLGGIIPPIVEAGLSFQPGRDWQYGPGVEIQGYLVEKWSGKDFSDFLVERLFKPLGMNDTGFFIDASKVDRVTKMHQIQGGRVVSVPSTVATTKPKRLSPSGGLMSTAEDYFKACQMVLAGGTYKGKQYIKPETVKLMHTNFLEPDVFVGMGGPGAGFGVDFAIVLDNKYTAVPAGSYYWAGAFGTWFWIDPTNEVVVVGMIQNQNPNTAAIVAKASQPKGVRGPDTPPAGAATGSLREISAIGVNNALKAGKGGK